MLPNLSVWVLLLSNTYCHYVTPFKKMFGPMHFIYYKNRSIATKVDSTYLGY